MNYLILQPKPPLDEAVGFLWLYDGYQPPLPATGSLKSARFDPSL
jgi:hypothetical protein